MGSYANGWSYTRWNERGFQQEIRCYSNNLVIENISLGESGAVITHRVWNNRWKEMVDKFTIREVAAASRYDRIDSFDFLETYLPAISAFMDAHYDKQNFKETYTAWLQEPVHDELDEYSYYQEYIWVLNAAKMEMVICCKRGEENFRWHIRTNNAATAIAAKAFIENLPVL